MIKVIRAYISAKREHVAVNGSIVRGRERTFTIMDLNS